MRKPVIAANWKMYKTRDEAEEFLEAFLPLVREVTGVDMILAPPFSALESVSRGIEGSPVELAAQNLYWEEEGAFTGEISAAMLCDLGCKYVIAGHSERRQYFGETDETVNKRLQAALKHGLVPIFCIGETLEQREADRTLDVVGAQVRKGLKGFEASELGGLIIAYEPVWAIGTGKTATAGQAQEVHAMIRELLKQLYGPGISDIIRIQYGGSVKPGNASELLACPDIDGALVGGASLKADSFAEIVRAGR
jgi:triosephosphate isomerase